MSSEWKKRSAFRKRTRPRFEAYENLNRNFSNRWRDTDHPLNCRDRKPGCRPHSIIAGLPILSAWTLPCMLLIADNMWAADNRQVAELLSQSWSRTHLRGHLALHFAESNSVCRFFCLIWDEFYFRKPSTPLFMKTLQWLLCHGHRATSSNGSVSW